MSYRKLVIVLFSVFLVSAGCTGNNTAMVASAENGGGSGAGGGSTGGANPVNTVTAVANSASLPACTTATSGSIFFLLDELKYKYCNGTTYAYLVPSATPGSTFSLGGTYSGAALPSPVWLQRNASETMLITNPGAFTFPTALVDQTDYFVAISSQPTTGEYCVLNNNYGRILGASVANLALDCKVPHFDFVDGNTADGLDVQPWNIARKHMTAVVHAGKLYLAWYEHDQFTLEGRINMKVYNGNDAAPAWQDVSSSSLIFPSLYSAKFSFISHSNNLYMALVLGEEGPPNNTGGTLRVMVYNGNDSAPAWSYTDTGPMNVDTTNQSAKHAKLVSNAGKLYAFWREGWPASTPSSRLRAAVYNGNDVAPSWALIDGGAADKGINSAANLDTYDLDATAHNGYVYVAWTERSSIHNSDRALRVYLYNGNDASPGWIRVDSSASTGMNRGLGSSDARSPVFAKLGNELLLAWKQLLTMPTQSDNYLISKFNGNVSSPGWFSLDNGISPFRWRIEGCPMGCPGDLEDRQLKLVSLSDNIWYNFGSTVGHYSGIANAGHRWYEIGVATSNAWTGTSSRFSWAFDSSTIDPQVNTMVAFNNKLFFVWRETAPMVGGRIRVKKLTNF